MRLWLRLLRAWVLTMRQKGRDAIRWTWSRWRHFFGLGFPSDSSKASPGASPPPPTLSAPVSRSVPDPPPGPVGESPSPPMPRPSKEGEPYERGAASPGESSRDLFVFRPRVLRVRRRDPRYISVGDEAEAEMGPGLMRLLTSRDAFGVRLDEGLCTEWVIGVGTAATAAYAALRLPGRSEYSWGGVRITTSWVRPARLGEALIAKARVEWVKKTSVTVAYRVFPANSGEAIAAGEFVLVYTPEGRPTPLDTFRAPSADFSAGADPSVPIPSGGIESGGPPPAPRRIRCVLVDDDPRAGSDTDWLEAALTLDRLADRYHARWTHLVPPSVSEARALNLMAYPHEYTSEGTLGTDPAGPIRILTAPIRLDDTSLDALHAWLNELVTQEENKDVILLFQARASVMARPENLDRLERHFRYVWLHYPYVEYVTLTEALEESLHHLAQGPRVRATRPVEISREPPVWRFPIRILGMPAQAPLDGSSTVTVQLPSYLPKEAIRRVTLLEKGMPVSEMTQEVGPITFPVRSPWGYELEVEMAPTWCPEAFQDLLKKFPRIPEDYLSWKNDPGRDYETLLALRRPYRLMEAVKDPDHPSPGDVWVWRFPIDLLRLLVHPLGGGREPLGRDFHPYGMIPEGAVLYTMHRVYGQTYKPVQMDLQIHRSLTGWEDLTLRCRTVAADDRTLVTEHELFENGMRIAQARLTSVRTPPAQASTRPRPLETYPEAVRVVPTPGRRQASIEQDLDAFDLYEAILALNPEYVRMIERVDPFLARFHRLYYAPADRRLYLIFGEGYVFFSQDGLQTLQEVREVNYEEGSALVPFGSQSIDAIVETVDGTVLLLGRDRRAVAGDDPSAEVGVVWRKPRGAESFARYEVCRPAWATSKSSCATAGFLGSRHTPAVALTVYGSEDAHFYYSLDDGRTWRRQDMSPYFRHHVHEVYLPRSVPHNRPARLWVTGGDDPSGERSGVICFEDLKEDGSLSEPLYVLRETPGYRLVSLAGNGKHVFIGNESLAGGVLKIQDNRESIEAKDFQYVFGKIRHEYHQFHTLIATYDGILVSGTSNYPIYAGDTVRGDSGGSLWVSNDEGDTFIEIPLGARWVTSVTYDGHGFWFGTSATREYGPDVSGDRFTVWRLRKPSPYQSLVSPYIAKVVLLDSSEFYRTAGYPVYPEPVLMPGDRTFRVNLAAYPSIEVDVAVGDAGTLVVEAAPFESWRLSAHPWHDVAVLSFEGPERRQYVLPPEATFHRLFRVRNASPHPMRIRWLAFIGRR